MLRYAVLVRTAVLIEPILMPLLKLQGEKQLFREYLEMAEHFINSVAAGNPDDAWRVSLTTAMARAPGRHCPKRRENGFGQRRRVPSSGFDPISTTPLRSRTLPYCPFLYSSCVARKRRFRIDEWQRSFETIFHGVVTKSSPVRSTCLR
jgi:hypothetical protein